jgi:uncharacterized protein (TIGR02246 family)
MTPALDEDQLRDFARRYTEAWCSQNPALVAENYSPDGSLTINDGSPSVGRAAITEAARSFMDAYPDMQVQMDDLRLHGAALEYHWTFIGTKSVWGAKTRCSPLEIIDLQAGRYFRHPTGRREPRQRGYLTPGSRGRTGANPGPRLLERGWRPELDTSTSTVVNTGNSSRPPRRQRRPKSA